MFSSIFGKRRASPVEENDIPPIPGARPDDGFVVVNPAPPAGGLYPNVSGLGGPGPATPARPAPPLPAPRPAVDNFHYLQGVPFTLSKELQMASNKNSFAIEIGDLLAIVMNKINISKYDYDFSTEKSVLKEC
ncbi:hypothetical protein JYU34_005533 [Plutella xylostella]|uniref:Uncharacterized protein n=2 Tax=Plutella xylostella TaxID=51655 RepID=A0ABQ7QTI1_PLUXY|nr:uncharacterized protein LOC105384161 [Plutella xylostella]KAG7308338.1 hypothetical protein JYU34_005533 [Plutella xylostella]CAG9136743.1 unnamed protein product [Plutella xylostella]